MGVAGCGKSTIGAALSDRLGIPYRDADDLHPQDNIDKMRRGIPLTDADRHPWLIRVGQALRDSPDLLVGCSALKRAYRDLIRRTAGAPVVFVHLAGPRDVIAARLAGRTGHFLPARLLDSQFAALEPPQADESAITVDVDRPLPAILADIVRRLG